ncbi:MAG: SusC/RagA family TonB-linked outer membrane protein, partial [Cellulophaga fucicola]
MKTKKGGILTLLLVFIVHLSFAQQKTISGTVTDQDGLPLPGVNILVKGTKTGTQTGFDGEYTISGNVGQVLIYTYLGQKETTRTIDSKNSINVQMEEDAEALDEIVVTGVARGTSTKKLGFALSKVSEESLQNVPASDPANALRGKVAGVRIVSPSGNPSSDASIRLRGSTSISGSQSPLIIVDGIITDGSLKDIAVENIESMEVIKGAAASSLYGSLAGNGVIQIITKKGRGKMQVTLKTEYGFSEIGNEYKLSEVHPYKNDPSGVRFGDWDNDPSTPETSNFGFDLSTGNRILDDDAIFDNPYLSQQVNNIDNIFTSQPFETNTISIGGSKEDINYFLSAQRNETKGIIKGLDPYKRNNFRANFDVKASDKITVKFNGSLAETNGINVTEQGQGANVFYSGLVVEPFIDLLEQTEDSQFSNVPSGYEVQGSNFQNPLYVLQNRSDVFNRQRLLLGGTLNYKINSDFDFVAQQSLDQTKYSYKGLVKSGFITPTPSPTLNNGSITLNESLTSTLVSSLQLNFYKELNDDLNISTSLKYLFENRQFKSLNNSGYDFIAAQGVETIQNTPIDNRTVTSYYQKEIAKNYFINADIDYKDKIILNGLVRFDQSSLFGSEERNKMYYRGSLAYRLSEDLKINGIEEFKLRAAYGTAGQRPPAFNAQYETFTVSQNSIVPGALGNNNLRPSETRELELGLDIDFLDRFSLSASYADTKTIDAMIRVPLSGVAGFSTQWQNIGEISSKYFELSLSGKVIKSKDFNWDFQVNFDKGTQEITNLNGIAAFTRNTNSAIDIFRVEEDLPYGTMFGQTFANSVDQLSTDDGGQVLNGAQGGTTGDYSVNKDGFVVLTSSIGTADEAPQKLYDKDSNSDLISKIGDTNPDFNVGFSSSFRYKNLGLYILTDWQQGGDIYNYTKQLLYFNERHADLQT